jgi:hypothetical protein
MPHAKIFTKQAMLTLGQLHAELAGKLQANKEEAERLRASMKHVEAVMKLLEPTTAYAPSPSAAGSLTHGSSAGPSYARPWAS